MFSVDGYSCMLNRCHVAKEETSSVNRQGAVCKIYDSVTFTLSFNHDRFGWWHLYEYMQVCPN